LRADQFTTALDANVIAGGFIRNNLLSLAEAGIYRPRWSSDILDEFRRFFVKRYDDEETATRQKSNMERAFPEALVEDYKTLIDALELPDKGEGHVLACAIQTKASVIVTKNLKDFPAEILQPHDVVAIGYKLPIAFEAEMACIE